MRDASAGSAPGRRLVDLLVQNRWALGVWIGGVACLVTMLLPTDSPARVALVNGASVVAVESNTRAYLKCLVVKELLDLQRCHFLLGDFVPYLQETPERFELLLASGVLYHSPDPLAMLALLGEPLFALPRGPGFYFSPLKLLDLVDDMLEGRVA